MELAVKSADDSVDVGNIDKKADRLVVEICEVDELVIDNRCECFEKLASVLCIHRFDTRKTSPSTIVDVAKILGGLL